MKNSTFNSRKNLNPIIGKQLAVKIAHHDYQKGLVTLGEVDEAEFASLGEVDEAEFALGRQLNK